MSGLCQIKASAGSGKTHTLTQNYISLLAGAPPAGQNPRSAAIIAITFTNAAASEMRARVISTLKKSALTGDKSTIDPTQAAQWLEIILRDMDCLNIRTIDSLLHMIARSSALDLGIHPDFEQIFTTSEALAPFLELFMEKARGDDPDGEEYRKLLSEGCEAIIQGRYSTGFLGGGRISKKIFEVADQCLLGLFTSLADKATINAVETGLRTRAIAAASAFLVSAEANGIQWNKNPLKAVESHAKGNFEKQTTYLEHESAEKLFKSKSPISASTEAAFQRWREDVKNFMEISLPLTAASRLLPFIKLATVIVSAFLGNRAQEGVVPSALIPVYASSILQSPQGVSDALVRLGTRLTHFLVDEFQDTSARQWDVLKPLALEALSRGGSLTWVGDVKQSIYGWREANPELFDAVRADSDLKAVAQESDSIILKANWRSARNIIEHTNRLFATLLDNETRKNCLAALLPDFPARVISETNARLANVFADVNQEFSPNTTLDGYVHMEEVQGEKTGDLNENVIGRLVSLVRDEVGSRRPWSDILILTRDNERARETARALIAAGVPVITENSLRLCEHPLVGEMIALLSFLANPDDELAFWTVITGSIFLSHPAATGISPESLIELAAGRGKTGLRESFIQAHPECWHRVFEPFDRHAALMTPYDIIMEWQNFMQVEQIHPAERVFTRRLLEILQYAESEGKATIQSFLEYWAEKGADEKTPMPGHMNAARIMTIHKAKGLEAPVVIVPWTNFSISPANEVTVIEKAGLRLPVLVNNKAAGDPYFESMARQALEAFNLLYVALTRAREELYFFHLKTASGKAKKFTRALEIMLEKAGLTPPYSLGKPAKLLAAKIPGSDKADSEKAQPSIEATDIEATDEDGWRPMSWLPRLKIFRSQLEAGKLSAGERGILLHSALEYLGFSGDAENDANSALAAAIRASGLNFDPQSDAGRDMVKTVAWFASLPQAREWLTHGWREQTLTDGQGNFLRPDLIIPQANGVLILDYKSGAPQAKYAAQVQSYLRCLVESGQYGHKARGLVVYLDQRVFQAVELDKTWPISTGPAFSGMDQ